MVSRKFLRALTCSASVISFSIAIGSATTASAQGAAAAPAAGGEEESEAIVVTGVRASLDRSIDMKREAFGVVDGISAEDMGKFANTNLAESLQHITGVSIDRVNGEGNQVTVRGLGPGYNLVTLNGRTLPASSIAVIGQDQGGDGAQGTSRSFNFSNIASEGVSALEVYKTARAAITSGGMGATINIVTPTPLKGPDGFSGNIGAKAVLDSSDTSYARVTPEVSGILNWKNAEGIFGINLFGSWQRRNNSATSVTVNDWNVVPYSHFLDPNSGFTNGSTVVHNAPTSASELVAIPNDARYDYSEFKRERLNAHGTMEFKPSDALDISLDGTFYQNKQSEQRSDQSIWLNRPFSDVTFDGNTQVATATHITDIINGVKDDDYEQQYRAVKDRLWDVGLNLKWKPTERLTLVLDGHIGKSDSLPNNPQGNTSTAVSIATHGTTGQQENIVNGFPQQLITFSDNPANGGQGNANGVIDVGDLGAQVARTWTSSQSQRIKELRLDGSWDLGNDDRIDFGASYRDTNMHSSQVSTYQTLGDWGVANVGDVAQIAPGIVQTFCEVCGLSHFSSSLSGVSQVGFRGDATQLYAKLSPAYAAMDAPGVTTHQVGQNGNVNDVVQEKIWAAYVQANVKTELLNRPAQFVVGVRYERTTSTSTALIQLPQSVVWQADNDFGTALSSTVQPNSAKNSYDNILPAMDFSVDLTDKLKGRLSYGRTIARPDFSNLFDSVSIGDHTPGRATALGGIATATSGNPFLVPLVSDNFDVSLEWYFKRSSYLSVGFFDKRVKNFVGNGTDNETLFGLTDPSSGAAGTRSGDAKAYLQSVGADLSDVNMFTMTALIDQFGLASAEQQYQAHLTNGQLQQSFVDSTLAAYDVTGNAADPKMVYQVKKPVNNRDADIWGLEIAGQYFLGDTGLGVTAAYTKVYSNVAFDITADPSADQFAVYGLSDTASASLIYEKHGLSVRGTFNWRDRYLSTSNRGGYNSPVFVAPYHQFDVSVAYDITPRIQLTAEGINLTKEDVKMYARTENQPWFIVQGNSRFLFGARYKF